MIKEKKSLKVSRSPSRRKFFKTAAATGVAAVAASSLSAPAVAKERIEASMVATWPRDFPGLGTGAQRLAQRLSDMSCLLYTSPSPRDPTSSRMPSSA